MKMRRISVKIICDFENWLRQEEKSEATIDKYIRDVRTFAEFASEKQISKDLVMEYKKQLLDKGYAIRSINSMLASINKLLNFLHWEDCRVRNIRVQKQIYCPENRELTKAEYLRLLKASSGNQQLNLILQTICATGIRVSELQYFTVEAIRQGEIRVSCKNKTRIILIPGKLKNLLLNYARKKRITRGILFLSGRGNPLNRSRIWAAMKQLCAAANVAETKVFPHNLRKLFAKTFYELKKDIAKLADILGHSSIDTTRIYIMTTGEEHRKSIEQLGLVI